MTGTRLTATGYRWTQLETGWLGAISYPRASSAQTVRRPAYRQLNGLKRGVYDRASNLKVASTTRELLQELLLLPCERERACTKKLIEPLGNLLRWRHSLFSSRKDIEKFLTPRASAKEGLAVALRPPLTRLDPPHPHPTRPRRRHLPLRTGRHPLYRLHLGHRRDEYRSLSP